MSRYTHGFHQTHTAKKMHLELLPGTQPRHAKPYPVPCHLLKVLRKELECLIKLGVLSSVGGTEWASLTFIIPKKTFELDGLLILGN
jgi:hypothetical protein